MYRDFLLKSKEEGKDITAIMLRCILVNFITERKHQFI